MTTKDGGEVPGLEEGTWLRSVEIHNFRLFASIKLDFHPQMTVLVAPNGCGKTAILSAIALAFSPFVDGMRPQNALGIELYDIRQVLNPVDGNMERVLPASIRVEADILGKPAEWTLKRDSDRPRARKYRLEELTDLVIRAHHLRQAVVDSVEKKREMTPMLPLLVAYGTSRVWDGGETPKAKRQDTSRFLGYDECLEPTASFAFFERWFKELSEAAVLEGATGILSLHKPRERLAVVNSVLSIVLEQSGWGDLSWDPVGKYISAGHPSLGRLPVFGLSDGIKSILAMAADLAHRCVRLNPHFGLEAATRTSGIVLIDEVDMHLHPAWQQTVLLSLQRAFPKVQFIVTTHSPHVLTTVEASSIRVLGADGSLTVPTQETKGVESPRVLTQVLGVNLVPPVEEARWVSSYEAAISSGEEESAESRELRARIVHHFGEHHPVVSELERLERWYAFQRKRGNRSGG